MLFCITGCRLDLAVNNLVLHPCAFGTVLFSLGAVVFTVAVNKKMRNYWKIIPLAQALWKFDDLSFVFPMIEGCILRKSQAKRLLLFSHFVHWQIGDELPQSCNEIALLKICEVQFWLLQISKILCGKIILTLFIKHLHSAKPSAMSPSYLKWCFFLDDCTRNSREEENSELKFLLGAYGKNVSLQEFHLIQTWIFPDSVGQAPVVAWLSGTGRREMFSSHSVFFIKKKSCRGVSP